MAQVQDRALFALGMCLRLIISYKACLIIRFTYLIGKNTLFRLMPHNVTPYARICRAAGKIRDFKIMGFAKLDEYSVSGPTGVWHLFRLWQKLGGRSKRLHFTDPLHCVGVPCHCSICVISMRTRFEHLKVMP